MSGWIWFILGMTVGIPIGQIAAPFVDWLMHRKLSSNGQWSVSKNPPKTPRPHALTQRDSSPESVNRTRVRRLDGKVRKHG